MKLFGRILLLCAFILVVITIESVKCHHQLKDCEEFFNAVGQKDFVVTPCQEGDYYIVSTFLVYFVVYATKYRGLHIDSSCPLGIAAANTFVDKKGKYFYFWNKSTATIQAILGEDEIEFLANYCQQENIVFDVEQVFNELVGCNGATLSPVALSFTEQFKKFLACLLDHHFNGDFLLNLNGLVNYHQIFSTLHLDPSKSPLCELIAIGNLEHLKDAIVRKSSILLHTKSVNVNPIDVKLKHYELPKTDPYWQYLFGCVPLLDTLDQEMHSVLNNNGFAIHELIFHCDTTTTTTAATETAVSNPLTNLIKGFLQNAINNAGQSQSGSESNGSGNDQSGNESGSSDKNKWKKVYSKTYYKY